MSAFPELAADWLPTRDTLQSYSQILGAVRRHLVPEQPHWWHISLQPVPHGLSTGAIELGHGGSLSLALELTDHKLRIELEGSELTALDIGEGLSSRQLGERVLRVCRDAGAELENEFNARADDENRDYDPQAAASYLAALLATREVFESVHSELDGSLGPIQLWPHHFDLSFEWFGSRMIESDEGESPSQIGFGFSTGDDSHQGAYYYATPWPFASEFTEAALPDGARWLTDPWQGGLLPYSEVVSAGEDLLSSYLHRVYEIGAPRLAG